jgi:hypothetical protein
MRSRQGAASAAPMRGSTAAICCASSRLAPKISSCAL